MQFPEYSCLSNASEADFSEEMNTKQAEEILPHGHRLADRAVLLMSTVASVLDLHWSF